MAALTHLFSVVPISDRERSVAWFRALFDHDPDEIAGDEIMWQVSETAWLVITDQEPPGGARLTLAVEGFTEVLDRMRRHGAVCEPVEQYANGVQHVVLIDPDGNRVALAGA